VKLSFNQLDQNGANDLIFVTPFLPIKIKSGLSNIEDDQNPQKIEILDNFRETGYMFYYISKVLHRDKRFPWVGWLVLEDFSLKDEVRKLLNFKYQYYPVFISKEDHTLLNTEIY
jgi:hypothetical protein